MLKEARGFGGKAPEVLPTTFLPSRPSNIHEGIFMDKPIQHIITVAKPGEYRMKCVRCKRFICRKDLKISIKYGGHACKNTVECERAISAKEEEG